MLRLSELVCTQAYLEMHTSFQRRQFGYHSPAKTCRLNIASLDITYIFGILEIGMTGCACGQSLGKVFSITNLPFSKSIWKTLRRL